MQVKEIMHKGLDFVTPSCSVREAARKMKALNIGALAVCEKEILKGIVTDRDIVTRADAEGFDLDELKVGDIMTPEPVCCYQEAGIETVARKMEERKIRRIPVVNRNERLVGMLSIDDFTRRGPSRDLLGEVLESAAARRAPARPAKAAARTAGKPRRGTRLVLLED